LTSTVLAMLIYPLWEVLIMTEEEYNAHEDREAEKYDIDKDRELLEALELADIVRKQMEVINHA
jgi:hypothetical protein